LFFPEVFFFIEGRNTLWCALRKPVSYQNKTSIEVQCNKYEIFLNFFNVVKDNIEGCRILFGLSISQMPLVRYR